MSSFDSFAPESAAASATDEKVGQLVNLAFAPLRVSPDQSFLEAGGHSLGVLELQRLLAHEFNVVVSYAELHKLATPRRIAAWVLAAPRRALVVRRAEAPRLPATPAQAAIYTAARMHPSPTAYNVPIVVELERTLGIDSIRRALLDLVARHAALRATFTVEDDRLLQSISPRARLPFSFHEIAVDMLEPTLAAFRQPFNLAAGPLLRAALFDSGAQRFTLILDFHHLIVDGVSVQVLLRDFGQLLEGIAPAPAANYAASLDDILTAATVQPDAEWAERFAATPLKATRLTDKTAHAQTANRAGFSRLPLSAQLIAAAQTAAAARGASLHSFFLATLNALLAKWTGEEEIVVGVPCSGRSLGESLHAVGLFARTMPSRLQVGGDLRFDALLAEASAAHVERMANACAEAAWRWAEGSPTGFGVVFASHRFDFTLGSRGRWRHFVYPEAHFGLLVTLVESADGFELHFEHNETLGSEFVEEFGHCLCHLASCFAAAPTARMAAVGLLDSPREQYWRTRLNPARIPLPLEGSLATHWAAVVERYGDAAALADDGETLSYAEVDARVAAIAATLTARGVASGDAVGLLSERSIDYVIAVLAIVKLGAAYVPLDPSYPVARLSYMAEAAHCRLCLALNEVALDLPMPVLPLGELYATGSARCAPAEAEIALDTTAYVMFTSGSTGQPKGVKVTHRNVLRLAAAGNVVPASADMRVLLTGSPSFDATTYEIWAPLLNGGSVSFVDKSTLLDSERLRTAIETHRPTTMWLTAPLFARHADADPHLFEGIDHLIVGGDTVSPVAVASVQASTPEVMIINGYGPTENTTFSTFHAARQGHQGALPVGRPIARSTAYVLDAGLQLLPPGGRGELFVGGDGVAAGYLDPALDENRFIDHVWPDGSRERLYRTGDLATAEPDGTIWLHGRRDGQVKIRGFRVEPGEICEALRQFAGIGNAHVACRHHDGHELLVAYLVATTDEVPDEGALLDHLQGRLPPHMVPAAYALVDSIPLTANGKVDENALPQTWRPLLGRSMAARHAPLSEAQRIVVDIWRELLRLESVGLDDDFFRLGGDSLKLVALASRLAAHGPRRPSIPALYRASTPRAQAEAFIADAAEPAAAAVVPALPRLEKIRLRATDAQARLVLLDQISRGEAPYLIPTLLRLEGAVDVDRIAAAWSALSLRHEALRSRFSIEGEAVWIDIGAEPASLRRLSTQNEVELALAHLLEGFSLADGDVATATLLESPRGAWLALVFHHAAFDGDSVEILLREFSALHAGRALPSAPPPLAEVWPQLLGQPEPAATRYWVDRLAGATSEIQLPCDRARGAQADYRGSTTFLGIPPALEASIQALAARSGMTPYMVWMGGALVTLARYARQNDLTIGTVSAGRTSVGSEGVCGMFANTLPLRFTLDGKASFEALLEEVRRVVLDGLEHQSFSLSELVAALPTQRESWRNPLFNVMFSYVDVGALHELGHGLRWERADWTYPHAKFDLTLFVHRIAGGNRVAIEAAEGALSVEAETFLRHWLQALAALTATPTAPLDSICLVDENERQRVLHAFNDTTAPQRDTLLMHEPFEARADSHPHACAVEQDNCRLSYIELDMAANQLAHALRAAGCGPSVPVLVMMDRSVQTLVAVIAVLKAGGYYVPVDPAHPAARLAGIAESLGVRLLVTDAAALAQRPDFIRSVDLDLVVCLGATPPAPMDTAGQVVLAEQLAALPMERPPRSAAPTDLAYTIFTSGSTGRPKGVAVAHRRAINLIDWVNATWDVGPQDKLLFVTSLCFDLSVYDIFGCLAAGATVHVARASDLRDPSRLVELLRDRAITFWDSAPAALQQVLQTAAHSGQPVSNTLRLCFLSGDWVPTSLPGSLRSLFPRARLVVLGGATEATVWSNFFEVCEDTSDWISIPYGRPIHNARYYVLDEGGQPCPVGVPGRLFIGGDCLAEGYAGAPALTAERFIPDPFIAESGARMYDTGDLARWRADGEMIFLGRCDHQVKVRGYRVEIGEVTHAIGSHPAVDQVLVLALHDPAGDMVLVAHVVPRSPVSAAELTAFLSAQLPAYMVPSWFSFLDALPATVNGKFDRERLPGIRELMALQQADVELDPSEAEIHAHWCAVLDRASVPPDLAFHAAGGSSLLLVRLFTRLDEQFPGIFTIPDLFILPTIREQAARVSAQADMPGGADGDEFSRLLDLVSRNEMDIDAALAQLPTVS